MSRLTPPAATPATDTERLRALTPARVRLDPRGATQPLDGLLDFQAGHARARDAVWREVDWAALMAALSPRPMIRVDSRAGERATYLRRPDLGRRLDAASRAALAPAGCDVAIVIADGLSSAAIDARAPDMVRALEAALDGLSLGPLVLARQARVGLGDEIGQALGARLVIMLIGERPGITVADSLGAYLTYAPAPGTPDSARNCVSNIHDRGGLSPEAAAARIGWLVREALVRGLTGTGLKDESVATPGLAAPE